MSDAGVTIHNLKSIPPYFAAIASGIKTFDVRYDDRGYQPGDVLSLSEYHPIPVPLLYSCQVEGCAVPGSLQSKGHVARAIDPIRRRITYIYGSDVRVPGLKAGYVVLGLGPESPMEPSGSEFVDAVREFIRAGHRVTNIVSSWNLPAST